MIQKVDVNRIAERLTGVIYDAIAVRDMEPEEKPIAVVGKEALTIIRRFQRTDKTNRKVLISEDAIKGVFHLPISKAAAELGVGLTVRGPPAVKTAVSFSLFCFLVAHRN